MNKKNLNSTSSVSLDNVSIKYGNSVAVKNVFCDIEKNHVTSFIGPSGCGKSTVIRAINRMNDLIEGCKLSGSVIFEGIDIYAEDIDPVEVRRRIGMVFQQPNPFPKTIYENIAFGARVNGYKGNMDQLVKTLVPNPPCQSVNPDEVVAIGAAIQGGIISGELRDLLLNDVTPLSLGLETVGGLMKVLIPRNTSIPVRQSDVFSTSASNQSSVEIHIWQGERQMASDNKSLGKFRLSGIPPAPRGVPQVQVAFDIDANGLLEVSATDRTTGRKQSVSVTGGSNLNQNEVNKLIEESKAKASEDRKKRASIDQKNNALTLVAQAERRLRDASLELGPYGAERQQRSVEIAMRDVEDMLEENDLQELEYAVASLQEALFGLNRRLSAERKTESNPIQGIRNTFGSLKDELFSDDYWDDDPWDYSQRTQNRNDDKSYGRRDIDPWDNDYYR